MTGIASLYLLRFLLCNVGYKKGFLLVEAF
jgi:hypothetical protein|nr:MAG TPA: hypothetical protein [Caudoviricetes sp.]